MRKLVPILAAVAALMAGPALAADVDCPDPWDGVGALNGNVTVNGPCTISGSVDGNVFVPDGETLRLTGSVNGNIEAWGTGQVNLDGGAIVFGNVKHEGGSGQVDFIADTGESIINGDVELKGGADLAATGTSMTNVVTDNIKCDRLENGSTTNWDNDGGPDSTGLDNGNYEC